MNNIGVWPRRAPQGPQPDSDASARPCLSTDGNGPVARADRVRPAGRPIATGPRLRRVGRGAAVSTDPIGKWAPVDLPCQLNDPDLWFAEAPDDLERAKALCDGCPAQLACLAGAIDRRESTGVWGGQILDHGQIVTHKRPRGRPRKDSAPPARYSALAG